MDGFIQPIKFERDTDSEALGVFFLCLRRLKAKNRSEAASEISIVLCRPFSAAQLRNIEDGKVYPKPWIFKGLMAYYDDLLVDPDGVRRFYSGG